MLVQSSTGRFPFPIIAEFPTLPGRNRLPSAGLRTHCSIASNAVNPDAPHSLGSDEEITVFVPTPWLLGGCKCFDPVKIPVA
ncbi:MAG: hypothetical protein ACREXY_20335 [Gammaproteobacteria bacterium]